MIRLSPCSAYNRRHFARISMTVKLDESSMNIGACVVRPRASINLCLAARANAFLVGRAYVTPQDVKDVALDILRHRVLLTYEAEAEETTSDDVVRKVLESVPVP